MCGERDQAHIRHPQEFGQTPRPKLEGHDLIKYNDRRASEGQPALPGWRRWPDANDLTISPSADRMTYPRPSRPATDQPSDPAADQMGCVQPIRDQKDPRAGNEYGQSEADDCGQQIEVKFARIPSPLTDKEKRCDRGVQRRIDEPIKAIFPSQSGKHRYRRGVAPMAFRFRRRFQRLPPCPRPQVSMA